MYLLLCTRTVLRCTSQIQGILRSGLFKTGELFLGRIVEYTISLAYPSEGGGYFTCSNDFYLPSRRLGGQHPMGRSQIIQPRENIAWSSINHSILLGSLPIFKGLYTITEAKPFKFIPKTMRKEIQYNKVLLYI
jgi:hypothetical protein